MNTIDLIIGAFGWAIVHSLWQIGTIALVVKLLLFVFKNGSAVLKYNLVLAGMVLASVMFLSTLVLTAERLSVTGTEPLSVSAEFQSEPILTTNLDPGLEKESVLRPNGQFAWFMKTVDRSTGYIMAGWLLGFVFFSIRFWGSYFFVIRIRKKYSSVLPGRWQAILMEIQEKMKISGQVRLLESATTAIPMVIGHLKPVIILPLGLATHIPFNQLEAILVHELAHISRKDYLLNLFISAMEGILFYHPLFWWLRGRLDTYREHCCDDRTIAYLGNPDPLQKALLDLSTFNKRSTHIAAALYKNNHQLLNRIKRMKTKNQKNHGTRFNLSTILIAVAIIGTSLAGSSLAPRQGEQWQSMSLIPDPPQVNHTVNIKPPMQPLPEKPAPLPDTTINQKKAGTTKKFDDDGVVSLQLDEKGNLLGVKKDGRELTGEERAKYERLAKKLQELSEKEKTIEKNREELEKVKQRLMETEMKMKEVEKEYNHAMQEYIEKHAESNWSAYDGSMELFGEQYLRTEELEEMIAKQRDLASLYQRKFYQDQDLWTKTRDDLIWDSLGDMNEWSLYRDQFEDQYIDAQEQLDKAMLEYELQQEMKEDYLLRQQDVWEKMEQLKTIEMEALLFEEAVREELVKDGLLDKASDELAFNLTEKRLVVNGEKQNSQLRDKYIKLYEKYAHGDVVGDKQVIIED
jgi:beta-lactamase regulating signal transducer with metallopeptidase domain